VDQQTLSLAVIVLAAIVFALAAWVALLQRSASTLRRRLRTVFARAGEEGLDEILDRILTDQERTAKRLDALNALHLELEALLRRTIQRVGVVRFNPFPDAGGDQSFAIALLDSEGNGLVVSSLHSRTETRVFAKPVAGGRSKHALSEEEQDAIDRALKPAERTR
jgi:hypothetical protein